MKFGNLLLAAILGAALAWLLLRSRVADPAPSATAPAAPSGVAEAAGPPVTAVAPDQVIDSATFRRASGAVGGGGAESLDRITPEPSPGPGLAEERARLFQALKEKEDPKLAELVEMLAEHRLNTAAVSASAWVLADNWGIYSQGEAEARKRIEDPEMFARLAQTRREILIEMPEAELKSVVGGPVDAVILRKIEEIGRKHPPAEKERQRKAGEPRRPRVRLPDEEIE